MTPAAHTGGTVLRDVEEIQLRRVKAHLARDARPSLIDCGYAGDSRRIERALIAGGLGLSDLARVVITHGHPDHAGSAQELAKLGIPVLIHPADAAKLTLTWRDAIRNPSRGHIFSAMTPAPPETVPIEDGEILPMLGGLRVVHTPGHTPGSVCLYGARDRILFVGDTLQRRFGRVSFASALYSDDHAMAKRSVKRLAALDVETIVFSHFAPLEGGCAEVLATLADQSG